MAYDSDSSSDHDTVLSDFRTTNVLLGYASKLPTEDSISHLGGNPVSPDTIDVRSADHSHYHRTGSTLLSLHLLL